MSTFELFLPLSVVNLYVCLLLKLWHSFTSVISKLVIKIQAGGYALKPSDKGHPI